MKENNTYKAGLHTGFYRLRSFAAGTLETAIAGGVFSEKFAAGLRHGHSMAQTQEEEEIEEKMLDMAVEEHDYDVPDMPAEPSIEEMEQERLEEIERLRTEGEEPEKEQER